VRAMIDAQRHDDLDRALDPLISQGRLAPTGDAELDTLLRLASRLRGLPDTDFKARLRAELFPPPARRPWWPFDRRSAMSTRIQHAIARPRVAAPLAFATAATDDGIYVAGFTNYAFRQIVREFGGAGLLATEMVCARSGAEIPVVTPSRASIETVNAV